MRELTVAYVHRQRWQARLQAVENAKAIAEVLGGKRGAGGGEAGAGYRKVSANELLGTMGVRL